MYSKEVKTRYLLLLISFELNENYIQYDDIVFICFDMLNTMFWCIWF